MPKTLVSFRVDFDHWQQFKGQARTAGTNATALIVRFVADSISAPGSTNQGELSQLKINLDKLSKRVETLEAFISGVPDNTDIDFASSTPSVSINGAVFPDPYARSSQMLSQQRQVNKGKGFGDLRPKK